MRRGPSAQSLGLADTQAALRCGIRLQLGPGSAIAGCLLQRRARRIPRARALPRQERGVSAAPTNPPTGSPRSTLVDERAIITTARHFIDNLYLDNATDIRRYLNRPGFGGGSVIWFRPQRGPVSHGSPPPRDLPSR